MFYCEICSDWMDCWNNCEECEIWLEEQGILSEDQFINASDNKTRQVKCRLELID